MNSRQLISDKAVKAIVALTLMATLCIAAAAQVVDPRQEGRKYGDAGFVGEPISLNVVNADIRDILNYVTEQYGINFVIDKSVASTSSPSDNRTARCTSFCNCRTLPGHSNPVSRSTALGV